MSGFEMRFGLSCITNTSGVADVVFTNGEKTYSKRYEVTSTYSEGVFTSLGGSSTTTTYTKDFPSDISEEEIYSSFEGIFATTSFSFSPFGNVRTGIPIIDKAIQSISFMYGKTSAITSDTHEYDKNGWKGQTSGAGFTTIDDPLGINIKGLGVNFGTQFTAYRDSAKPKNDFCDHPD